MKRMIILLLLALPLYAKTGEFKSGSEPTGFRGLRWGSPPTKDMQRIPVSNAGPGVKKYIRPGDTLTWGRAQLDSITYTYLYGKLWSVCAWVHTGSFFALRDALFSAYGEGEYNWQGTGPEPRVNGRLVEEISTDTYIWTGKVVGMYLIYTDKRGLGYGERSCYLWILTDQKGTKKSRARK